MRNLALALLIMTSLAPSVSHAAERCDRMEAGLDPGQDIQKSTAYMFATSRCTENGKFTSYKLIVDVRLVIDGEIHDQELEVSTIQIANPDVRKIYNEKLANAHEGNVSIYQIKGAFDARVIPLVEAFYRLPEDASEAALDEAGMKITAEMFRVLRDALK